MFYTTIIGYKFLQPGFFTPKRAKGGHVVKNKYDRIVEEDCPRAEITKQPIIAWRSSRELLEGMPANIKRVTNAIESYISESPSAVWYHNGNCDALSLFGGRHLHLITLVDDNFDGTSKSLYNNNKYRNLRKLLIEQEGYMKSQQVRDLQRLCQHLTCPPRIYMGTREGTIGRIMMGLTPVPNIGYDTCVSDLPNFETTEEFAATSSEWDIDTLESLQTNTDPWATTSSPWDETPTHTLWSDASDIATKAQTNILQVKETFADKMVVFWICEPRTEMSRSARSLFPGQSCLSSANSC